MNLRLVANRTARVAALVVIGSTTTSMARAQVSNWAQYAPTGHWYGETTSRLSWSAVEFMARALGGHSATVRSPAESQWLASQYFSVVPAGEFHWIGLYQDRTDPTYAEPNGAWKWASAENGTFLNWRPGAPDNAVAREDFARTRIQGQAYAPDQWDDESDFGAPPTAGSFDWYVAPGEVVVFNTASSVINASQIAFVAGTHDIISVTPAGTATIAGGIVDLDDFYVDAGGRVKVEGPHSFKVMATGRVVIRGLVDCSGTSSNGVTTLNTANIPEPGAPGQAGGGRGGTGSPSTTSSDSKGGDGFGAFDAPNHGGEGGETGWSLQPSLDARRGAGGGGGTLGPDAYFQFPLNPAPGALFEQRRIGFDGERGFDNLLGDNGAINGANGPIGGRVGPMPFRDPNPTNNFCGTMVIAATGLPVIGELVRPWAGAGGGAGGDAARISSGTFPGPWIPTGDEKGAGGGGGGGSLHILALGPIVFGASGQIRCRGGFGGGGESTIYLNRVGGGSGGGSGGHVVLDSASVIDFSDRTTSTTYVNLDFLGTPINQNTWAIDCRGGQGGAGSGDVGGAINSTSGQKETLPLQDACPPGYPTAGTNACRGHVHGAGGDGGPGIVQLHTAAGAVGTPTTPGADILVANGVDLTWLCAPPPLCRDNTPTSNTTRMMMTVGTGRGLVELTSTDCDNNSIPDVYEIAESQRLDLDHSGVLDVCETPCFRDADADGFGAPPVAFVGFCVPGFSTNSLDCDDTNAAVHPSASESCNGVDDDCDALVDEDFLFTYCTAGTSVHGCAPAMSSAGMPSSIAGSGFVLNCSGIDGQRFGRVFYGPNSTAISWAINSTSYLCVAPPRQSTGVQFSGGAAGACDGSFSIDFNAFMSANPTAVGSPFLAGDTFYAQAWFRDPAAPTGTNLSNGFRFELCQ